MYFFYFPAPCKYSPCEHGGTCTPDVFGNTYICTCPEGFFGHVCQCMYGCVALFSVALFYVVDVMYLGELMQTNNLQR